MYTLCKPFSKIWKRIHAQEIEFQICEIKIHSCEFKYNFWEIHQEMVLFCVIILTPSSVVLARHLVFFSDIFTQTIYLSLRFLVYFLTAKFAFSYIFFVKISIQYIFLVILKRKIILFFIFWKLSHLFSYHKFKKTHTQRNIKHI